MFNSYCSAKVKEEAPTKKIRASPAALSWSLDRVCEWLVTVNLEPLVPLFQDQEIDGEALLTMTEEDLNQLNLKLGLKARLRNRIQELKNNEI